MKVNRAAKLKCRNVARTQEKMAVIAQRRPTRTDRYLSRSPK
jgi:hypothetical protein